MPKFKKKKLKPFTYTKKTQTGAFTVHAGTHGHICPKKARWPDGRIGWQPHTATETKTYAVYGTTDGGAKWVFDEGSDFVVKYSPNFVRGRSEVILIHKRAPDRGKGIGRRRAMKNR